MRLLNYLSNPYPPLDRQRVGLMDTRLSSPLLQNYRTNSDSQTHREEPYLRHSKTALRGCMMIRHQKGVGHANE